MPRPCHQITAHYMSQFEHLVKGWASTNYLHYCGSVSRSGKLLAEDDPSIYPVPVRHLRCGSLTGCLELMSRSRTAAVHLLPQTYTYVRGPLSPRGSTALLLRMVNRQVTHSFRSLALRVQIRKSSINGARNEYMVS